MAADDADAPIDRRPLRVVLVVTQLETGGAQSVALQLAEGLRRRGHRAETWFMYRKHPAYEDAAHTTVIAENKPRTLPGVRGLGRALSRRFRDRSADVAIGFTYYANAIALSAAMKAGVRARIATQHNPAWAYPRLGRWMDHRAGTRGVYTANIAVSRAVADTFRHHAARYRSLLQVIPNGICPLEPKRDRDETRAAIGVPLRAPLILAAGRLVEQKNHATLVRAMADAPGVHLAIAGEGHLRLSLERIASRAGVADRLHLLGQVPPSDVRDLMAAADVFAMPSLHEGMSLTLLEALAAGLPVIASSIPAQAEVLQPGGTDPVGILHDPSDRSGLASALQQLTSNEPLRREYARRSLARSEDFSITRMVDRYESLILRSAPAGATSRGP